VRATLPVAASAPTLTTSRTVHSKDPGRP